MSILRLTITLIILLVICGVRPIYAETSPAFIKVVDGDLQLKGAPFHFVGANLSVTWSTDRSSAIETIKSAASSQITVGRVWALGEAEADAGQWFRENGMLRAGPDGWLEDGFRHLDKIVATAAANNMRLIIVLANRWPDLGGIPQYTRWAGLSDWWQFYNDEQCRNWYRAHLAKLILRRNTITGQLYRDDPTIMAWELGNELSAPLNKRELLTDWVVEMARYIRTIDNNHLVGAGVESYTTPQERDWWIALHRLAKIDYADIHLYPNSAPWDTGWPRIENILTERAATAHDLGLPLLIGEYGFLTSMGDRAEQMCHFIELARNIGASGTLFWTYGPVSQDHDGYHISFLDDSDKSIRDMLQGIDLQHWPFAVRRQHMPLNDTEVHARRIHRAHSNRHWRHWQIRIPVDRYAFAEWSRWGYAAKPQTKLQDGKVTSRSHVYGWQSGQFRYLVENSHKRRVVLKFRASTEWPGADSPEDWQGPVEIYINGKRIKQMLNVRDDGQGRVFRLAMTLPAGKVEIEFSVRDKQARGLCLYDRIELSAL